MKTIVFTILIFMWGLGCKNDREANSKDINSKPESELKFDKAKWDIKDGVHYPFREKMLNDIVYNDTIRSLNGDEILTLLGEPSYYRGDKNFLHYRISQTKLGLWTTKTKTMVIKLADDNTVDWIKIHE